MRSKLSCTVFANWFRQTTQKDSAWDKGAMLLRAGVDPDLLGWDREAEDWAEITDI